MTLTGAVSTLATLAVFQALGNAFLVGLVAWLVISPEHVANLRRRLANIRERMTGRASRADMRAFGASDAACYKWPDDSREHRALRAAYVEGAADSV